MRSENGKFNDLHWFHTKSMTWEKVPSVAGDVPSERGGCTFMTLGRKVVAFCGRAQDDVFSRALDPKSLARHPRCLNLSPPLPFSTPSVPHVNVRVGTLRNVRWLTAPS